MNVLAIYVANELLQSQLDQSVARRMAHQIPSGPDLRDRIAAAGAGLRRLFGAPIDSISVMPKLEDYPYRG